MNRRLKMLLKELSHITPFRRYFFPRYSYNFTVPQLCFLCQCIEDTRHCDGSIVEVGCSEGSTTLFLNKYMDEQHIEKTYYAIDTFSGFVEDDINYEVTKRKKTRDQVTGFQVNKKKWFDRTMKQNNISRVISIKSDVNKFDFEKLGSLSFALLDVDLYRPMIKSIKQLYKILSPSGILIVDDCNPSDIRWDGSDEAYKEFMTEINQPFRILYDKLGVIKK